MLDGSSVNAWWAEDFTLAEIKQLRARERIPTVRPANARLDGQLESDAAGSHRPREGAGGGDRPQIGIYPETKHPTYTRSLGLNMEEALVKILKKNGYEGKRERVFIQSFEVANLMQLAQMTIFHWSNSSAARIADR